MEGCHQMNIGIVCKPTFKISNQTTVSFNIASRFCSFVNFVDVLSQAR